MTRKTPEWLSKNPFGHDLESAHHLQSVVADCLREKQVYRIDHYLGKDTVNNLLATRFSNTVFEPLWNRNYIEEVQIYATETIGCEGRFSVLRQCRCRKRYASKPLVADLGVDCDGTSIKNKCH